MTKFILVAVSLFAGAATVCAQKVIDRSIPVQGKKARMDFKFADTIMIEAWNRNTVELYVTANISRSDSRIGY